MGQAFQLDIRLHVKAANPGLQRNTHLVAALAYTGKYTTGRITAGLHYALQLTRRDNVKARTELCQDAEYGQVGVGLHRITDEMWVAGQCLIEHPPVVLKGGTRIDVTWGAMRCGNCGELDILGIQPVVPVVEMVHGD